MKPEEKVKLLSCEVSILCIFFCFSFLLDAGPLSVMIEHSTGSYVLCTLQRGVLFQQPLNLEFAAGEELSFFINGNGTIHFFLVFWMNVVQVFIKWSLITQHKSWDFLVFIDLQNLHCNLLVAISKMSLYAYHCAGLYPTSNSWEPKTTIPCHGKFVAKCCFSRYFMEYFGNMEEQAT